MLRCGCMRLTVRRRERYPVGLTPPDWMNVGRGWITPIVIVLFPAIKMDENPVSQNVTHGSHTSQGGVHLIYSLKLLARSEVVWGHILWKTNTETCGTGVDILLCSCTNVHIFHAAISIYLQQC